MMSFKKSEKMIMKRIWDLHIVICSTAGMQALASVTSNMWTSYLVEALAAQELESILTLGDVPPGIY